MIPLPQTLRQYLDTKDFDALVQGDKTFDLRPDDQDITTGDYYLFVERLPDGSVGRQIYRRVSYVVRLNDVDEALTQHPNGIVAVSFVAADYMTLEGLLANNTTVVAYTFEKQSGQIRIMTEPIGLPLMTIEGINAYQVSDFLRAARWPDGQYSVTLRCRFSEADAEAIQDLDIQETIIMARTMLDGVDKLVSVDHRFLVDGHLRDLFGNPLEARFGDIENGGQSDAVDTASLDRTLETPNKGRF